jgi:hypothetical protein
MARDELDRFGAAEEIELAPVRSDDASRKAVMIWIVRLGDDLYVRSAYGRGSAWFCTVQTQHQGPISCKVNEKDATFLRRQEPETRRSMQATVANTTATERGSSTCGSPERDWQLSSRRRTQPD